MRSALIVLASGLIVVALSNGAPGETRTWTDRSGKYTVRAEFVQLNEQVVTLRLPNARELAVQVGQLSKADQQFVQTALAATKAAVLAKAGTAPEASSVVATQVEEPNKDVAKRPFALFDISPGMTDREVANVFRRKGIRLDAGVRYRASAMNKFAGAPQQRFAYEVRYTREKRSGVGTYVTVHFMEDLPTRPGHGICVGVGYTDRLDGGPNVAPVAQKVLETLISRYGEPTKRTDGSAVFGDENACHLSLATNDGDVYLWVGDKLLHKRLNDAYEKIAAIKVPPPPAVAGPLDF